MPKRYMGKDVLTAARERVAIAFDDFERVVVSFSGGKDSTVLLHLAIQEAERRGRKVDALFIDLEAQYRLTVDHVADLMAHPSVTPWWVCLPLNLRNAVSVFEPHWTAWDPQARDRWVRSPPRAQGVLDDPARFPFWRHRMEFEEFIVEFPRWFCEREGVETYASLVGIRSDESLHRYNAVAERPGGPKKSVFVRENGDPVRWGTVMDRRRPGIVSLYPIYDWGFEDVWTFLGREGLPYNRLYDRMWQAGVPNGAMRICQPYGDDQRRGLDMWARVEPETWGAVLDRVVGVGYGARYAGDRLLGYDRGVGLPEGHTWKSYTFLLLSTLPKVVREQYLSKFAVFLEWWFRQGCPGWADMLDDETEALKASGRHRLPSWRRLGLCVLKNDFNGKSLSIGMVKDVVGDVYDRVEAGLPVQVRRSVRPVYDELRRLYAEYEVGGIGAIPLDMPERERSADELRRKYEKL